VRGQFDGGSITSDAGGLLLREVEKRTGIIGQFANCFTDVAGAVGTGILICWLAHCFGGGSGPVSPSQP